MRFLLRLWHYPSFAVNRSWGIYQKHEPGSRLVRTLIRQVTWDRPADAERLVKPLVGLEKGLHSQPTIEVRDRPLETAALEQRLEQLRAISFSAFASRGIGIDGEVFGITFPVSGAGVEWWCERPASWRELTSWASEMRQWLTGITTMAPQSEIWRAPRPRLP